jgi:hypothetical protein
VKQRGVGVLEIAVGRPVGDAVPGPVLGVQVVLLLSGLEVIGLDPDHDVLHGGNPPVANEQLKRANENQPG